MLNWRTKKPSQNVQPKYSGKKINFFIIYFVFKVQTHKKHKIYTKFFFTILPILYKYTIQQVGIGRR